MINIQETSQITKIYLVTNCYGDPNKIYIGKEKYPKRRKRESDHRQKYGKQIIFTYIDEINSLNSKDWKPLECFWIEYFRFLGFELMNGNKGGGGCDFMSSESKSKLNKPVLQYSKDNKFIKTWSSITEAHSYFGVNCGFIGSCCVGKTKTAYGYIWRFEDNPLPENYITTPHKNSKEILQYDKMNNFIKTWNNSIEAASSLNKNSPTNITNCCNGSRKSAYGYIWRYKNNPLSNNYIQNTHKNSKKVIQYDLKGNELKIWNSISDISRSLNKDVNSYISGCCRGKFSKAFGFKWSYIP